MNSIFYDDKILAHYEQQEQWEESVTYLVNLMYLNMQNKHILYRLAAQCWYVLTFWDCNMPKERLNRTVFESNLELVYYLAQIKWWNDADCLWIFGYFMSINQMDFKYVNTDIRDVEKEGNDLILKSISLNPNNELAKILFLADNAKKRKYNSAKMNLRKSIFLFFPSNSKVDVYFAEIFTSVF